MSEWWRLDTYASGTERRVSKGAAFFNTEDACLYAATSLHRENPELYGVCYAVQTEDPAP